MGRWKLLLTAVFPPGRPWTEEPVVVGTGCTTHLVISHRFSPFLMASLLSSKMSFANFLSGVTGSQPVSMQSWTKIRDAVMISEKMMLTGSPLAWDPWVAEPRAVLTLALLLTLPLLLSVKSALVWNGVDVTEKRAQEVNAGGAHELEVSKLPKLFEEWIAGRKLGGEGW